MELEHSVSARWDCLKLDHLGKKIDQSDIKFVKVIEWMFLTNVTPSDFKLHIWWQKLAIIFYYEFNDFFFTF
jgi:hypothetical protein